MQKIMHDELVEAAQRLREAEEELKNARKFIANVIARAAKNQQVTRIAQITGINRTTIYWLMNNWGTSENGHRDS